MVKLWDVTTGKHAATLKGHSQSISCVAYSPDGKRLASTGDDLTIKLWDVSTLKETATLTDHESGGTFAFSPDGKIIAATENRDVQFWDVSSGKPTTSWTVADEDEMALVVAFSSDGKLVATGATDKTVKIWEFPGDDPDEEVNAPAQNAPNGADAAANQIVAADGSFGFAFPTKLPAKDRLGNDPRKPRSQFKGLPPAYTFTDGGMTYVLLVDDLPADFDEQAAEQSLRFARDSQIKSLDGKLVRQKNVEVDGCRGLEFTFSHESQILGRDEPDVSCVRLLYVRKRLYLLSVEGSSKVFSRQRARQFFDSFELLKKDAGAANAATGGDAPPQ